MTAAAGLGSSILAAALAVLPSCVEPPRSATEPSARVALFDRAWHWTDEQGAAVTFSLWRGAPLVVTAIYTSCATRCPLTVEKLQNLDAALRRNGVIGQFILVTLDPQSDDSARLRRFKESRHLPPSWHLLWGSHEDTVEFGRMLGVRAMSDAGHIDHDVRIAVFDASGRLLQNFGGWDFDEDKAAKAL